MLVAHTVLRFSSDRLNNLRWHHDERISLLGYSRPLLSTRIEYHWHTNLLGFALRDINRPIDAAVLTLTQHLFLVVIHCDAVTSVDLH